MRGVYTSLMKETYEMPVDRHMHSVSSFFFPVGRVVDEVEALKAILMDELIVRTNERLVFIFIGMLQCYQSSFNMS
jgi:hypothetical protein